MKKLKKSQFVGGIRLKHQLDLNYLFLTQIKYTFISSCRLRILSKIVKTHSYNSTYFIEIIMTLCEWRLLVILIYFYFLIRILLWLPCHSFLPLILVNKFNYKVNLLILFLKIAKFVGKEGKVDLM